MRPALSIVSCVIIYGIIPWVTPIINAKIRRGSPDQQAAFGVFEYGLDLLTRHAGKPLEKIRHCRAVFKVLEERRHRHAGVLHAHGADPSAGWLTWKLPDAGLK